MTVHSVSKKGRRPQNEDRHTTIINLNGKTINKNLAPVNLFAVYDGHGGKHISRFLEKHLPGYFVDKRVSYPLKKKYVNSVYNSIQDILRTTYRSMALSCGSTCLIAVQFKLADNDYINILNTGDSRCVLSSDGIAMPLTKDHKPNWPDEMHRIKQAGGEIVFDGFDFRIKDLSVSRAFGDIDAEPYVINKPEIFLRKLSKKDKFMILACDGVWDILSNQDVVNIVLENCYDSDGNRINKKNNIAKKISEIAFEKGSTDNLTTLVVFFD
jgi:serine/threonine protein phosphatase PrpC